MDRHLVFKDGQRSRLPWLPVHGVVPWTIILHELCPRRRSYQSYPRRHRECCHGRRAHQRVTFGLATIFLPFVWLPIVRAVSPLKHHFCLLVVTGRPSPITARGWRGCREPAASKKSHDLAIPKAPFLISWSSLFSHHQLHQPPPFRWPPTTVCLLVATICQPPLLPAPPWHLNHSPASDHHPSSDFAVHSSTSMLSVVASRFLSPSSVHYTRTGRGKVLIKEGSQRVGILRELGLYCLRTKECSDRSITW